MEKIDILLIRPNSEIPQMDAPLGLGYLAADLIKNRISVAIKDCLFDNSSVEDLMVFIKENEIKIVGISCCTDEVLWVKSLIMKIEADTDIKIIIGGPHPSCVLEKIYEEIKGGYFSIYSEGEASLSLLVKAILENDLKSERLGNISNLIWKNGDKIIKNHHKLIENLDDIDFPAWDLINPRKYSRKIPHGYMYKASPFAPIIATRGCPHGCSFCSTANIHGHRIRKRSQENIISEIKYLSKRHGIREIFFKDDNFTFDEKFAKDFCDKLIYLNTGIFFGLPNGICLDKVSDEMLALMRKANFYSFGVGIESGSEKILRSMGKDTNLEALKNKISLARKYGFYITGFFILGYPGETREDIELTIKYAREVDIDKAAFNKYLPLPGTKSYNNLVDNGEMKCRQYFGGITIKDIPYSPEGISKDEIRNYLKKAVLSFYFRPSIILRNIFRIKINHLDYLYRIFKRFS
jgi:radical SAM superfamily enzyme YgiQ (UPF0313 family)